MIIETLRMKLSQQKKYFHPTQKKLTMSPNSQSNQVDD